MNDYQYSPRTRKNWGSSREELAERMEEALLTQEAFDNEWKNYQAFKAKKAPVQEIPVVDWYINADPRTRKRGESVDTVLARRAEAKVQELAELEKQREKSSEVYEKKVFDQMEQMNLGRQYNVGVPHWARQELDED